MKNQQLRTAFVVFHCTLALVVLEQSIRALLHVPNTNPLGIRFLLFAGLEALAAILFIIPLTLRWGGWMLLGIFTVAVALHGVVEQSALLVYAAGVIFVMVHGSAFKRREPVPTK